MMFGLQLFGVPPTSGFLTFQCLIGIIILAGLAGRRHMAYVTDLGSAFRGSAGEGQSEQ